MFDEDREFFKVRVAWWPAIESLSLEQKGMLLEALFNFNRGGEKIPYPKDIAVRVAAFFCFSSFEQDIDDNAIASIPK